VRKISSGDVGEWKVVVRVRGGFSLRWGRGERAALFVNCGGGEERQSVTMSGDNRLE
jgi:hypothetical protein